MSLKGIQRKHHHVWRHYLTKWCVDKKIWYTTSKGNIANDSVTGLSRETDFYKISFLTSDDVIFVKGFIDKSDQKIQELHLELLTYVEDISSKYYFCERAGLLVETEVLNTFNSAKYELIEKMHTGIENDTRDILDGLSNGDFSVLKSNSNLIQFHHFLGHQFTRSKAFKDRSIRGVTVAMSEHYVGRNKELFERNWWLLSYIFGLNMGAANYMNRVNDQLVFLVNNTNLGFITSDQSIINVHESLQGLSEREAPKYMDLYYPVSPKFAVMLNNSNRFGNGEYQVSIKEVKELNLRVALKANEHIYADSEDLIKSVKQQVRESNKQL
jgi:hypothetical protein